MRILTLAALIFLVLSPKAFGLEDVELVSNGLNLHEAGGSLAKQYVVYKGALYFSASDNISGLELWKYDGTTVSQVADIWPGANNSFASPMLVYNDILYLAASDGIHGVELWKYDGTNLSMVEDIVPGPESSTPREFVEYNNKIYFWARDEFDAGKFMEYDGISFRIILDIGAGDSDRPNAAVYNGELYFYGYDPIHGRELWKFNGTTASFVAEIRPGSNVSAISDLIVFQNNLYFSAIDGGVNYGRALWKYDGNVVTMAADVNPNLTDLSLYSVVELNGNLYFTAGHPIYGEELWRFDGTNATLAADINPSGSSTPRSITLFNGSLYFSASGGLYKFDGNTLSVIALLSPTRFTPFQDTLFFSAGGLWKLIFSNACLTKTDYTPGVGCSTTTVIANDTSTLDQYLTDFGFDGTSYQNLEVAFDVAQSAVEIHSPCQITLNNINVTSDSVCIDGREGVNNGSGSMNAPQITILSEAGSVSYGPSSIVEAEQFTVDALRRVTVGNNTQMNVSGPANIKSSGGLSNSTVTIQNNSILNANDLNIEGTSVNIGVGGQINVGNFASLIATGTGGGNDVKLSQGVQVFAGSLDMTSGSKATLGANVMVTTEGNFNMEAGAPNKCTIANSAVVSADSTSGNCWE